MNETNSLIDIIKHLKIIIKNISKEGDIYISKDIIDHFRMVVELIDKVKIDNYIVDVIKELWDEMQFYPYERLIQLKLNDLSRCFENLLINID